MSEVERIWMDDQDGLIIVGDVLDGLEHLDDNSVEAVVTDPPYELNFMGRRWDNAGVSFRRETWEACWRVLKPGGHMVVFGGTRTHHRMWCAIEDAGFEVRDMLIWMYGQGFPKSLDVSKAIDKVAGAEREVLGPNPNYRPNKGAHKNAIMSPMAPGEAEVRSAPATDAAKKWEGWGTALKPAVEPILLARKPLSEPTVAANVLKWGTGALNIDGTRIGTERRVNAAAGNKPGGNSLNMSRVGMPQDVQGKVAEGRWPANVLLECTCADDTEGGHESDCAAGMLDEQSGEHKSPQPYIRKSGSALKEVYGDYASRDGQINASYGDSGGASRFFYCAKASRKERGEANKHPTVKPLALMRWLVRLVTPLDGIVLDPFCGSGSTLVAAVEEGHGFVGIDLSPEYCATAQRRVEGIACG